MGSGIATICLLSGYKVNLYDPSPEALEKAKMRIAKRSGDLSVLKLCQDLAEVASNADMVIEAVPEKLSLKQQIFRELDGFAPSHTIFASNTSELSVTAMAAVTKRPSQCIGMHWFNPPERMKLIEIVQAVQTSQETITAIQEMSKRCGKESVLVKDRQGFVTTRAVAALLLESVRMLEEGVASPQDIDTAVKLGLNHPMGPLELSDYIGLDTMLFISESMTEALGERFLAPQTLRKLVEAGHLGRKTGQGFYHYDK